MAPLPQGAEKHLVRLAALGQAIGYQDQAVTLKMSRNRERRHQMEMARLKGQTIETELEDENEVFNLGDVTINQYMPAAEPVPVIQQQAEPVAPAKSQPASTAAKMLAAGAVAAGLLGLGATGPGIVAGAASALTNAISVEVQGQDIPQGQSTTVTTGGDSAGN